MGLCPDRATIVYCDKLREVYKRTPIIIGGIEASLRRLGHYDYWDNRGRRSILLDSGADLLLYGMGEYQIVEMAEALESGLPIAELTFLRGAVYKTKDISRAYDPIILPKFKEMQRDKRAYAESFMIQYENTDAITAKTLVEEYDEWIVVQNPPSQPLKMQELDRVYALNYERRYHPMYEEKGGIPAIEEVKFSLVSNRGCFGNCNFCALALHRGRAVTARSHNSLVAEAEKIIWEPDFKGYIHDVGRSHGELSWSCLQKAGNAGRLQGQAMPLLDEMRQSEIPKVKKVFIRSGIRYDYLIYDKDETFFKELCKYHVSGQLKVAPEYVSEKVQDFYPAPGTFSTAMYYTGLDPRTMERVYVPKMPHEKAMQRADAISPAAEL